MNKVKVKVVQSKVFHLTAGFVRPYSVLQAPVNQRSDSAIRHTSNKAIPLDIMIRLYKAFILPHFEYASPLFLGLSKGLSAKLQSTNAFALRTLLNHSRLTAYEELLKMAHINSLEHRRIEQALILVYKSIYDQAPVYILEMFTLRNNGYSLRGHFKIVLLRPTSSYMQHSFMYQAGKQWNNLPDEIRTSESLSIFNKNLQNLQLSSSYNCNCIFCK